MYFVVDPSKRLHTFEIFGYDFMIDSSFKVYLIEVNTNPCLEVSCPLLGRIIPSMIDSAVKIAVDPLFPPPESAGKKIPACDQLAENHFVLVFDERTDRVDLADYVSRCRAVDIIGLLLGYCR